METIRGILNRAPIIAVHAPAELVSVVMIGFAYFARHFANTA